MARAPGHNPRRGSGAGKGRIGLGRARPFLGTGRVEASLNCVERVLVEADRTRGTGFPHQGADFGCDDHLAFALLDERVPDLSQRGSRSRRRASGEEAE